MNNPLKFIDPTGMVVEWNDSEKNCDENGNCTTKAQRKYETRLKELSESKNKKDRKKGEQLTKKYKKLQDSDVVFEVVSDKQSGSNRGEISYQGNDHFTINLSGNDRNGLSDNQRLSHEFEHGRQILDGELSFHLTHGEWKQFARDMTDEAKAFIAGFDTEPAIQAQGTIINALGRAINARGINGAIEVIERYGINNYENLPKGPVNVPPGLPPTYYYPPK